ncbi:meiotic nuclear division protein 1 homolog isoform X2 [Rhinoderma darwinii]|uniref:meiotic nuclear division protein 1 homolog isoform X2 n=1 Tax=Rhinoderma darwinii TaxID=43563 RepID=UPI003F672C1A
MKDVFQLKDLEKIAPKQKGITSMSVKDVLQSLVDDGMVDSERIGTSNYFWAFPSKALHARKRKLETLEGQFSEASQKKKQLEQSVQKAKVGRQDTEDRTKLAEELASLRQQREQLMTELEKYKECDPDVIDEIREANKVAKEAVNRWTGPERSREEILHPPSPMEKESACGVPPGNSLPGGQRFAVDGLSLYGGVSQYLTRLQDQGVLYPDLPHSTLGTRGDSYRWSGTVHLREG